MESKWFIGAVLAILASAAFFFHKLYIKYKIRAKVTELDFKAYKKKKKANERINKKKLAKDQSREELHHNFDPDDPWDGLQSDKKK